MSRLLLLALLGLFGSLPLNGCGPKPDQPQPVLKTENDPPKPNDGPRDNEGKRDLLVNLQPAPLTPQERYDAAVANAFRFLADKKEDAALTAFVEAQSAVESEFVRGEIDRLKLRVGRRVAAERTLDDIKAVLDSGKPDQASRLASEALDRYGDSDLADGLSNLKRQADALLAVQMKDEPKKLPFLNEAEAARQAKNYRAAVVAFEQAQGSGEDVTALKPNYDDLRAKMTRYDEQRTRAAELRRDPGKLEEALAAYQEAKTAWETPQVVQEIEETQLALNSRRDRLAVADFEVVGDVGIPLAGRTIAEEILPFMKGRFDLVERSQLQAISQNLSLDPAALQASERNRAELGRLAKARFLVIGTVTRLNGVIVNARIVDVQSGLIVQTAKIVAGTPKELMEKLPLLARILLMSDDQKIQYEDELAKAVTLAPVAQVPPEIPPAPPAPPQEPQPQAPVVAPIIINSPRPPEIGQIAFADFNNIPSPTPQPAPVIIIDTTPCRQQAFYVAIELGDNFFRRGRFIEAIRQFEFALSLSPGNPDVCLRIDRCRPFLPPPVVVIPITKPRLAILPFIEIGRFGFVPPGYGVWTADHLAPYFFANYDVVDRGEVCWWMNRLGLSQRDVLVNPSARLLLGRAMGVRFFLMGNLRDTASFDVTTHLIDAEFNNQVGSGRIHVRNPFELKLRLHELANLTMMPPNQQALFVTDTVVVERQIQQAQVFIKSGKFSLGITVYKEVLVTRPDCVEARYALIEAERQHRQLEIAEARRFAFEQDQARIQAEQQRQLILAAEAERQRFEAQRYAAAQAEAQRHTHGQQQQQAFLNLRVQGQNAFKNRQFALSIGFFESASAIQRSPDVMNDLAAARAQAAEADRFRLAQEAAARDAALQAQRQAEAEASRQAFLGEQQRQQQEAATQRQREAAKIKADYDRLIDQAQQAKSKGNYDLAVSNLQTARSLRPSQEIEALVAGALVDQAKAVADRQGAAERKRLEAQLLLEQQRRAQAEQEAAANKLKYEGVLTQARASMKQRKFAEARKQFQEASQVMRTADAVAGIRQADDEMAKEIAAAAEIQKVQDEKQKRTANVTRLIGESRQSMQAKKFDLAKQSLQDAIKLEPGNVEAQGEMIKLQQAQTDHLAAIRKQKDDQDRQTNFQKHLDTGRANLTAKQYDAAMVAFSEALKINPADATAQAAMKDAQQQHDASIKDAQDAAEAKKKRDAYEKWMQQGRTALNLKNVDGAIDAFTNAQQTLPGDLTSAQMLADAKKSKTDAEAANATRVKTAAFNQAMTRVRDAIKTNRFDDATKAMADAAQIDAANPDLAKAQQEMTLARDAFANMQKTREEEARKNKFATLLSTTKQLILSKQFDAADKSLAEAKTVIPTDPQLAILAKEIMDGRAAAQTQIMAQQEAAKRQMAYDAAIKAAQAALTAGKFPEAAQQFNEALKIKPEDAVAKAGLTDAQKNIANEQNMSKVQAAYAAVMQSGQDLLKMNKFAEAAAKFNEALTIKPKDPAAAQGVQQANAGVQMATDLAQRTKTHTDLMNAARAALAANKFDDAIKAAQDAQKQLPNDMTAGLLIKQAEKAKTDAIAMTGEADRKKNYAAALQAAQAAITGGKYDEAINAANMALKFQPNDPTATQLAAQALKAKTDMANAGAAEAARKQSYTAAIQAAQAALTGGKFDEAINAASMALKFQPNDPTANQLIQQAGKAKVDSANAAAAMAAEAERKRNYAAAIMAGRNAMQAKQFAQAVEQFTRALQLQPNDPTATQGLNEAKTALIPPPPPKKVEPPPPPPKKVDPAQVTYEQQIVAARATFTQKNFAQALAHATEALKVKPNDPEATNIANASRTALTPPPPPKKVEPPPPPPPPKVDPAVAAYNAQIAAARVTFAQKNFAQALAHATEALKAKPNDGEATNIANASRAALTPPPPPKKVDPPPPPPQPKKVDPPPPPANGNQNQAAYDQQITAARATFAQKNFGQAIAHATEALKAKPNDPEATKIINDARASLPKKK